MKLLTSIGILALVVGMVGCDGPQPKADEVQQQNQEKLQAQGVAQVGLPAIKNFREMKLYKMIIEMRDQNIATYTYLQDLNGKLRFFGNTVGFGIPYATEFTSPMKDSFHGSLPQADPNGLFSPSSAEGTWVLMKDPHGTELKPVYIEPRCVILPFKADDSIVEK